MFSGQDHFELVPAWELGLEAEDVGLRLSLVSSGVLKRALESPQEALSLRCADFFPNNSHCTLFYI